jgi:hypothetical protein
MTSKDMDQYLSEKVREQYAEREGREAKKATELRELSAIFPLLKLACSKIENSGLILTAELVEEALQIFFVNTEYGLRIMFSTNEAILGSHKFAVLLGDFMVQLGAVTHKNGVVGFKIAVSKRSLAL